jgi:hypothetical protein
VNTAPSIQSKLPAIAGELIEQYGATSGIGTFVWTGRALQAGFDDLEMIGLALLYPALERALVLPAIMDIRAHPISF